MLQTPIQGWMMAIVSCKRRYIHFHLDYCWKCSPHLAELVIFLQVMALLSGFAGVYTEVCLVALCFSCKYLTVNEFIWCKTLGKVFIYLWTWQAIIKKRPSRNINVQNFWLYIFGVIFNLVAICVQDYDAVMNKLVLMEITTLMLPLVEFMYLTLSYSILSGTEAFSMGIHSSQF